MTKLGLVIGLMAMTGTIAGAWQVLADPPQLPPQCPYCTPHIPPSPPPKPPPPPPEPPSPTH